MNQFIITAALTVMLTSISHACIGGTWLQVINNQDVVATYDITSGRMIALNKSYKIDRVSIVLEDYTTEDVPTRLLDICADAICSQLDDINNAQVIINFSKYNSTQKRVESFVKVISNVNIGANAPIARGLIPKGTTSDPLTIQACSKK